MTLNFVRANSRMRFRLRPYVQLAFSAFVVAFAAASPFNSAAAAPLLAGVGKVDITNDDVPLVNDRMYARALVIQDGKTTAVIVSVDAVAIGEIGPINNEYLGIVRSQIEKDLGISPKNIMINASHCHGIVRGDSAELTVQAIKEATGNLVPVTVGVGIGHEDRVQENRRLKLKSGKEADVRHAYSLPPDEEVVGVGPIDPEIGILKVDREDGTTLAVAYVFACHPIQGVPNGGNTADMTGFSSKAIEESLGDGAVAVFVQGCGGDINPIFYKAVDYPRDAEPLGDMLGLSVLKGLHSIKTDGNQELKVINETIAVPRADLADRIAAQESEVTRLVQSLRATSLNLKTFLPLVMKYRLNEEFPTYYSHSYLNEVMVGRDGLTKLDAQNRANMESYIKNIHTMEQLTITQTNLALLKKNQAKNVASGSRTIDVELVGLRVGDFVLTTFPGELTVQIGLTLKEMSPHENTFVAGYTNGYIYYCPTPEQLKNVGNAQEDSDCILAPEWYPIYEARAVELLKKL
ncbi:MAG: hypothetical protein WD065_01460 [Planctomycetaceae bacterium]